MNDVANAIMDRDPLAPPPRRRVVMTHDYVCLDVRSWRLRPRAAFNLDVVAMRN
jgi:hypothetical protein